MLYIVVNHGEVVQVIDESQKPQPKLLSEGTDYIVEYVPENKPLDWLPKDGMSIPASKKQAGKK
jgi:hypothetical protein